MPTTAQPVFSRPLLASVIGWVLVVSGASALFTVGVYLDAGPARDLWAAQGLNPTSVLWVNLVTGVATALAGWGVLNGHRWGRTLYLTVAVLSLIASAALFGLGPFMLAFLGAWTGLLAFLLTRPSMNAHFDGTYVRDEHAQARRRVLRRLRREEREPNDLKRFFGVCFAVGAGLCFTFTTLMLGTLSTAGVGVALEQAAQHRGADGAAHQDADGHHDDEHDDHDHGSGHGGSLPEDRGPGGAGG